MKPIQLTMSAYGPYAQIVEIPFDRFGGQGLFLITGDTGAGKTTIFDGITYALFGTVSGSIRTTATLRSDFAEETAETYVLLRFSHRDQIYTICRSPEYQRLKKKGTGTTVKPAEVEFHLPGGKVLTKQKEVDEAVEALLGVTYKQWNQISMIAQGEFQKLLNADSKSRGEIFRKVFHTEGLLSLQSELTTLLSLYKKSWEEGKQSLLQYMDQLLCGEDSRYLEPLQELKRQNTVYLIDDCMGLAQDITMEDQEGETKWIEQRQLIQNQMERIRKKRTEAEHSNKLFQEWEETTKQVKELEQQKEKMEALKETAQLQRKALYEILPLERAWKGEEEQEERLRQQKETWTKQLELQNANLTRLLKEQERLEETEPLIQRLTIEIIQQTDRLPQYKKAEEKEKELTGFAEELEKRKSGLQTRKEEQQQLKEQMAEGECVAQLWKQAQIQNEQGVGQEREFRRVKEEVENRIQLLTRYGKTWEQRQTAKIHYLKIESTVREAQADCQKNELRYWREQAGLLAISLEEGQPCPVCGALHHPDKAVLSAEVCTKEQLDEQQRRLEKKRKELQEKGEQLATIGGTLEELQQQWGEKEIGETWTDLLTQERAEEKALEKTMREFRDKQKQLETDMKKWKTRMDMGEEIENRWNEVREIVQKEEWEIHGLQESGRVQQQAYEEYRRQLEFPSGEKAAWALQQKKEEKRKLEEDKKSIAQQVERGRNQVLQQQAQLKEKEEQIPQVQQRGELRKREFLAGLLAGGFADEQQYRERFTDQGTVEDNEKIVKQYEKTEMELRTKSAQFRRSLEGKMPIDPIPLERDFIACTEQIEALNEKIKLLSGRMLQNEFIRGKIAKAKETYDKAEHQYSMVKQLADTACGTLSGKQKIAFEQYVQAGYFEQVLHRANDRLSVMSNNRYSLQTRADGFDLRSQSGLDLDVFDAYTGKRRGVKSLSGGESFQASLALALGMSDVMQRALGGIQLDTLFIDEGFGSLDQDALDQAIRVLYTLTEGNRLIGIISHVSELKESIEKKVIVSASRGSDSGKGSRIRLET